MKRFLALLIVAVMLLSFTACGNNEDNVTATCWNCGETVSNTAAYCANCGSAVADNPNNTEFSTTESATATEGTQSAEGTKDTTVTEEPHSHSYSSKVTKSATCTEKGVNTFTCSCGDSYSEDIKANGHSYSPATCDAPQKCTICGNTNGNALGHDFSSGNCSRCGKDDPEKEAQYNAASRAYVNLNQTAQGVEIIMDAIYNGWYFAIYKADEYSTAKECIAAFCNRTGLDHDEVVISINKQIEYLGYEVSGTTQMAVLRTFSNTVEVIVRIYSEKGWYAEFNDTLLSAQNDIASLTSKYEDITGYSTLKKYYSEVFAYSQFAASPSGSFSQLESTINTYETNIRKYNNELAFLFLF